jgi:hypothetical protein
MTQNVYVPRAFLLMYESVTLVALTIYPARCTMPSNLKLTKVNSNYVFVLFSLNGSYVQSSKSIAPHRPVASQRSKSRHLEAVPYIPLPVSSPTYVIRTLHRVPLFVE